MVNGSGVGVICFISEYWKMKYDWSLKNCFFERFDNALLIEIGTPLHFSKGCTALERKRTLKIHFLLFLDTPIKLLSSKDIIMSNAWLKFELNWKRRTEVINFQSLAFYNIDPPFNYTFTHKIKTTNDRSMKLWKSEANISRHTQFGVVNKSSY